MCLDFANTVEWHAAASPEDRLRNYSDLMEWAVEAGIIDEETARRWTEESRSQPGEAARILKRALSFREALYRIFSAVARNAAPDEDDLAALNGILGDALGRLTLDYGSDGFRLGWPPLDKCGPGSVLWPIARSAADLLAAGDPSRIRQCADDRGCGWLFLDQSRNRSRRWCSMEDCGNRAKAGRHFRRQRKESVS